MLKNILSNETCAKCRLCCIFDKYDVWETPVITRELFVKLSAERHDLKMVSKGVSGGYVFNMENCWDEEEEIFRCPALDPKKGCTLGDNKPFDCRIWPFRVMETEDKRFRMITVSPVCPEIFDRPLSQLSEFVKEKLENTVFDYAEKNPEIVKKYIKGYQVLAIRKQK